MNEDRKMCGECWGLGRFLLTSLGSGCSVVWVIVGSRLMGKSRYMF